MAIRKTIGSLPVANLTDDTLLEHETGGQSGKTSVAALRAIIIPNGVPSLEDVNDRLDNLDAGLSDIANVYGNITTAEAAAAAAEGIRQQVVTERGYAESMASSAAGFRDQAEDEAQAALAQAQAAAAEALAANEAASAAAISLAASETAKIAAQAAATNAAADEALAEAHKVAAGASATSASGSATTATGQAAIATDAASAAATSQSVAAGHASTATTQAGVATTQAAAATSSASTATTASNLSATYRDQAAASATAASGSAGTATTQAGIATTQAAAATAAGSTATTQAGLSASSATNAANSASAASTSASNAASASTAAGNSATAANSAKVAAEAANTNAQSAASAASGSSATATAAASTATSQATLSANFATTAKIQEALVTGADFARLSTLTNWGGNIFSAQADYVNTAASAVTVAGEGTVYNMTTWPAQFRTRKFLSVKSGRTFRFEDRYRTLVNSPTAYQPAAYCGYELYNAAGDIVNRVYALVHIIVAATGWSSRSIDVTADTMLGISSDAAYVSLIGLYNYRDELNPLNSTQQVSVFRMTDVTEVVAAASSASVATTQAASATAAASTATTASNLSATYRDQAAASATAASGSAGTASTQAGIATTQAASATASAASASSSATLSASITPNSRAKDPYMTLWSDAATQSNWIAWNNTVSRVAGLQAQYSARVTTSAGFSAGRYQQIPFSPGWWVEEMEVTLNAGNLRGVGIHTHSYTNAVGATGQITQTDFYSRHGDGVAGRTYRVSQLMQFTLNCDYAQHYAMTHWNGFAGTGGDIGYRNDITIRYCGIRPATETEIRDQTVLAPLQGTVATHTSQISALVTSDAAAVTSITNLTATLAGVTSPASLLSNPNFTDYPTTTGNPPKGPYSFGDTGGLSRVAGFNGTGYGVEWNATPGAIAGLWIPNDSNNPGLTTVRAGWYVFELDMKIRNGRLNGLEMYASIRDQGNNEIGALFGMTLWNTAENNTGGIIGDGDINKLYSFKFLREISNAAARSLVVYFFNYGQDTGQGKHPTVYKFNVRAATPQEIRERTVLDPAVATVATHTSQIAALVTQDSAIATSLTTLTASIGGAAGGALNVNPNFGNWAGASGTLPAGWSDWSNGYGNTKVVNEIGGFSYQQPVYDAGGAYGLVQYPPAMDMKKGAGWYVVELEVTLVSGTLQGAGAYLVQNGITGLTVGLFAELGTAGVAGRRYKVSKLLNFTNDSLQTWILYAMSNWTGFGATAAKTITWHRCAVRDATPQEIRDQTVLAPLQATVSTQATAIATLNGYTAARWVTSAVAGSGRAQLAIYADANGGGGVDIIGDVKINGSLVVTGSLTSTQLGANAATNGGNVYTAGSVNMSTSWQDAAEVTVAMIGGAAKIDFACYIAGQGINGGGTIQFRLLRNGSEIRVGTLCLLPGEQTVYGGNIGDNPQSVYQPIAGMFPFFVLDTSGATGSVVYKAQIRSPFGNYSYCDFAERQMSVTEFRR